MTPQKLVRRKSDLKSVSIPFNNLIFKIQYKAEEAGIECVVVEESYTSKVDHLAKRRDEDTRQLSWTKNEKRTI